MVNIEILAKTVSIGMEAG